jgi:hypothetical protein
MLTIKALESAVGLFFALSLLLQLDLKGKPEQDAFQAFEGIMLPA